MKEVSRNAGPFTLDKLSDPLARELLAARRDRNVLKISDDPGLPLSRAATISHQLYGAIQAEGAVQIGWKLGATNEGAQGRLRSSGPFVAPMFDTALVENGGTVPKSRFTQPRIEVEVGISVTSAGVLVAPCIEIADCHFPEWRISIGEAIADFGLNGAVAFGELQAVPHDVIEIETTLSRDGVVVAEGRALLATLIERTIRLAPNPGGESLVASGQITGLLPLEDGLWVADLQYLGSVSVRVAG
jgi:2-keto-4-pentenoate hydratase